jgi:predicted TIM-barrel fold metal-dependent hydrolase
MAPQASITDGYAHCGLSKYRPIESVRQVMSTFAVDRAVLVQHLGEFDNSYIGQIVQDDPAMFAGVMLVDTDDDSAAAHVDQWAKRYPFRGIRLIAETLATQRKVWEAAVACGLHIIVFAEAGIASCGNELARFSAEHPAARFVISHFGVPVGADVADMARHISIRNLIDQTNVFVQISAMHMLADPPYRDLVQLVESLVRTIGPGRLLYGSNYPVMVHDSVYGLEIDLLRQGRLGVPIDHFEQVTYGTAQQLWFDAT